MALIDGKRQEGKALLETSELIFRGAECRVKITFAEMREVEAADGQLRIKTKAAAFAFEIGAAAGKWREKILHPKTRTEKLGVKPGSRVALSGKTDPAFLNELQVTKAQFATAGKHADLIFLTLQSDGGTGEVAKFAKKLQGAAGLWVVYPKGKKDLTEGDVISAGRKAGLRDVKVCGFSGTHTALKFVIPVEKR